MVWFGLVCQLTPGNQIVAIPRVKTARDVGIRFARSEPASGMVACDSTGGELKELGREPTRDLRHEYLSTLCMYGIHKQSATGHRF